MLLSRASPLVQSMDPFNPSTSTNHITVPQSALPLSSFSPEIHHLSPEEALSEKTHMSTVDIDMSDEPFQEASEAGSVTFQDLPVEIHEAVLDHLFGVRGSALACIFPAKAGTSSWSKALRHPRRKALSDLALVSPLWRPLVQERIYRHIQVKGTTESLQQCVDWFTVHPYLSPYVRHIEFIVPVWGDRVRKPLPFNLAQHNRIIGAENTTSLASMATVLQATVSDLHNPGATYWTGGGFSSANSNASLQQIFSHVALLFPDARILTLESVHCKKPRMIGHFDSNHQGPSDDMHFDVLPNIQSFVLKGAWNVMRDYDHWSNLSHALPNLRELHCAYAKAKPEVHMTVAKILATMPKLLTRLNISLDGLCGKTGDQGRLFAVNSGDRHHLCPHFGRVAPQLESLTFTGKVCSSLFNSIRTAAKKSSALQRLRSVDLVVTSCCCECTDERGSPGIHELSGVTNMAFIKAFERLVISAIRSLAVLPFLDYLRIRFIDLDSAYGLLNPYFQMVGDRCTGLWSETILESLHEARPTAYFEELSDGIYNRYGIDIQTGISSYPRSIPRSIKASAYEIIADGSKM